MSSSHARFGSHTDPTFRSEPRPAGEVIRRVSVYLRPYRWHVAAGILLSIVVSAMEAVRPYFIKHAMDVDIKNGDPHALLMTTLAFTALMLVRGFIQYLNTYLTQWIGQKTIFDLRMEVFEHLQNLGLRYFDRNPIGRLKADSAQRPLQ